MARIPATRTLENALRRVGFCHVGGVDEVGRGCLAGPVVAAAVVLHPERHVPGVCDSKLVSAEERERLFPEIVRAAIAWSVGMADPREIDDLNIHRASLRAMRRAVLALMFRYIFAMRIFSEVWLLTEGGPARMTEVLAVYLYRQAFRYHEFGGASATGWMLLLLSLVIALPYLRAMYVKLFRHG